MATAASATSNASQGAGAQGNTGTGVMAPLLEDTVNCPFMHKGWNTHSKYHIERLDVSPCCTASMGGITNFVIPKIQDQIGEVQLILKFRFDAIGSVADVAYRNFYTAGLVPGACYAAIREVKVSYSTGATQRITGEEIYIFDHLRHSTNDKYLLDGLTDISNATAASANTEDSTSRVSAGFYDPVVSGNIDGTGIEVVYTVNLPLWWTLDPSLYLEYLTLANDLRIDVEFNPMNSILKVNRGLNTNLPIPDIANGPDIRNAMLVSAKLRVMHIHLPNHRRLKLHQSVNQTQEGVLKKTVDYERHNRIGINAVGMTHYEVNLTNFRSPTIALIFYLRKKADVDSRVLLGAAGQAGRGQRATSGPTYWDLQTVGRHHLKGNNVILYPEVDDVYCRYYVGGRHWNNDTPSNMYTINFTIDPQNVVDSTGSLDFGNIHNPTLVLDWDTPITGDYYLDVIALTHNFTQLKGGDMISVFM